MANKINITAELNAATKEGKIADAAQIYDGQAGKFQGTINKELTDGLEKTITSEDTGKVVESIEEGIVHNALRKTKQILTEAEKEQARENIGAVSEQTFENEAVRVKKQVFTSEQKYQARHNISAITAEEAEKIAQDKINETSVSSPDKLQAVKELSSWLEENPDNAATMNEKISENYADIQRLYRGTGIDEYSQFSTLSTYSTGDIVLYDGVLFRFKADHVAGEWDYNEVEEWSEKKEREELASEISLMNSPMFYRGVIRPNGTFHLYNDSVTEDYIFSEYIYIKHSEKIIIKGATSNEYLSSYSFYTEDKRNISNTVGSHPWPPKELNKIILSKEEIPEDAAYICITSRSPYKDKCVIVQNFNNAVFEDVKNLQDFTNSLDNTIEYQVNSIPLPNENFSNIQTHWLPGYIKHNGVLANYSSGENYMRTEYINVEGINKIYIRGGYANQYLSPIAFYDKDKAFISAPLNTTENINNLNGDIDVPTNAVYAAFTSKQNAIPRIYFNASLAMSILVNKTNIHKNADSIQENKNSIITLAGYTRQSDLSDINTSGFIAPNGNPSDNPGWVYGVIPLFEGSSVLIFNNLPSAQYSESVLNYFVDKDGERIEGSEFRGNVVLGVEYVEIEIPKTAKGLLLNANTNAVRTYDIKQRAYGFVDNIKNDVDNIKNDVDNIKNDVDNIRENRFIVCPKELYAVVGEEFNLYYDSLIKGMDAGLASPKGIYIDIQCPTLQNASNRVGVRRERMWQIVGDKLTSQYVGNHSLLITAYNDTGNIIDRKNASIIVSNPSPLSVQKNILCIGDSLTNNGPIVSTCAEHFLNIGGVQPKFIGQRTTSGFKHEGYPGYTFGSFVTSGSANAYFIFDIPEGTSVSVGDTYSTNGSTYNVTDIRTEGQDNALRLRCTRSGSTMPSSTGTLTKVSGTSSSPSSINYSAFEVETGNPFWDTETSSVNFTKYREKMGMAAEKFDAVVIMLGTNDCIGNIRASMLPSVDNAKTLINAILSDAADYPTKIILQITPADANTISSWQVYSDIMDDGRKIGYWTNLWNLRNLLYNEFTKEEWAGKVYLGQSALGLDRYYGYPYSEVVSSNRISEVKEIYHTNSVHPNVEGYKQLGDGYYLQIKGLL